MVVWTVLATVTGVQIAPYVPATLDTGLIETGVGVLVAVIAVALFPMASGVVGDATTGAVLVVRVRRKRRLRSLSRRPVAGSSSKSHSAPARAFRSAGRYRPDSARSVRRSASHQSSSLVTMSADRPCAIWMSVELLSVHAVRSVTASIISRAEGKPLPDFLTPPKGSWTSAPIHGRLP